METRKVIGGILVGIPLACVAVVTLGLIYSMGWGAVFGFILAVSFIVGCMLLELNND